MEFNGAKPIYLQLADVICEKILLKEWKEEDRIPSVRDFAVSVEVNPNTVMRTYSFLQDKDIITNQRGVGFFVSANGFEKAKSFLTEQFVGSDLKNVFKVMDLLNIDVEKLKDFYKNFKSNG